MNPLLLPAVAVLLWSLPAGAAPVYKCEQEGKVIYTDQPCSTGARAAELPGLVVTEPPPASQRDLARAWDERLARERAERDKADAVWLKEHARQADRQARVRKAILEHRVIKSMTMDEVRQALGEPQQVDTGDSYGTAKASWVYLDGTHRRVVNFKDGEVTSTTRRSRKAR
jgi:hypothetical protein